MTGASGPGRIITFYSYKGGTGRTMLLANVAWVLASNGKRVLVVDWDLEAPGLHRYLHPFLVDPELTATEGVIDFMTDYSVRAMTPNPESGEWWRSLADISRYAVSLEHAFPAGATFDFAPAGRQGDVYAARVNSFNWQDFYNRLGGGAFLEVVTERMRADYDYVLVDSRTGVSDTAGICTVQLPDALVVCFTLNTQSIEGAAAVAESVSAQRHIPIFPIPTRIEFAEKQKLDLARSRAHERFAPVMSHLDPAGRDAYWGGVEVIYQPFYAYEEVLATFADRPNQTNSLLAAVERITSHITGGDVERLVPPSDADRRLVLARFSGEPEPSIPSPSAASNEVTELARQLAAKEQEVASLAAQQHKAGRRRRRLGIVAGLAAVAALATGAVVISSRSDTPSVALIEVDPETLDFGTRASGDVDKQDLTITATAKGPVPVHGVTIDGSADFAVHSDACADQELGLTPEGEDAEYEPTCIITLAFNPGSDGEGSGHRHGTMTIVTHDQNGNDTTVSLDLTGCKETCD